MRMILIDEDHVWEISDPKVDQALELSSASAKGRLTTKQKCVLSQILDKFRNKPEVPALLKPKKGH